jgi:uncharacterized membrane protein
MTAVGIAMLWKAGQKREVPWSTKMFVGSLIQGWGIFNLVEGIIDHHILHVHHVIERLGVSIADWLFLGIGGVLLILIGNAVINSGSKDDYGDQPSPAARN